MKRKTLLMALFLAVTLALMCSAWADDDDDGEDEVEYECACNLACEWKYQITFQSNPLCCEPWDFQSETCPSGEVKVFYDDIPKENLTNDSFKADCESEDYANRMCEQNTRSKVWEEVNRNKDEICPEAQTPLGGTIKYLKTNDRCRFKEEGCAAAYLLREGVVHLDILREFRDEVLSTSNAGRKLIALYDEYSHVLIEIFEEYPAIKAHAKEMLEKIIPGIELFLNGESKAGLLNEEISAEADILIEEIDSVLASTLKETLTKLREDVKAEGILE